MGLQVPEWLKEMAERAKEAGASLEPPEGLPDILGEMEGSFLKVGFAAESENIVENAKKKLEEKQLDIIVANDVTEADSGFAVDTNKVVIIDKQGNVEDLPLLTKREVADRILDRVVALISKK